jgi:hypothetical protein
MEPEFPVLVESADGEAPVPRCPVPVRDSLRGRSRRASLSMLGRPGDNPESPGRLINKQLASRRPAVGIDNTLPPKTGSMAKQTQKARQTKRRGAAGKPPSPEEFKQARYLLRQRADALILDLAKRYRVSAASELTTVLDAMDSLAELEKMHHLGDPPVSPRSAAELAVDRK